MTPELTVFVAVAAAWVLLHLLVAGSPLRWAIAGRIGEPGFQGMFSLLSLVGYVALIWTYRGAAAYGVNFDLWIPTRAALWVPLVVMPIAWLLLIGSVSAPNPTLVGSEKVLQKDEPARGILRITRHPMLWAFVLWAAAHTIANGDAASLVLFAAIAVPAINGMFSIDRKRRRREPDGWQRYEAVTSIIPFAAIAGGRNRFVLAEIGVGRVVAALLVTAGVIAIHPYVIGVSALPF
jgi:uncharacterized membrane protein